MAEHPSRVVVRHESGVTTIELNRPEAINALDLGMIRDIDAALDAVDADPTSRAVIFCGAGERGFCAGGDVRQLYFDVSAGDLDAPRRYFQTEYALNARIDEFPQPIVALMHGACMGGGVGLAGHASLRIVTDESKIAMPETKIGFTPDVGGSWLLGQAPGCLGERLGLHGQVMGPAEAIAAGFADFFVPANRWHELPRRITEGAQDGDILSAVTELSDDPGTPAFGLDTETIDEVYSLPTVREIRDALSEIDPAGALELDALSPTALEVTLRSVRAARAMTLRQALAQEQMLAEWFFTQRRDTLEGIRALLVDKDKSPTWPEIAREFPI